MEMLAERNAEALRGFVPPEAEMEPTPHLVGPPPRQVLRRFSGRRVIATTEQFIVSSDNRTIYSDPSYPWCCIGQISTPSGRGTAALVGETFVLTASHVLAGLWAADQPLTQAITFTPGMFGGTSVLGPDWTANVTGIAAWKQIRGVVGYDVAICKLDQPMGDWLGYFGCRSYNSTWEGHALWEHAGYPYDLSMNGDEPCYQFGITVDDDDTDDYDTVELETNADTASGQSGGPLWAVFKDGGNQIIGVLSGNEDGTLETSNVFAGGNGLVNLVTWGRQTWT
jgi:V8-like Glu-specific endopeptidase